MSLNACWQRQLYWEPLYVKYKVFMYSIYILNNSIILLYNIIGMAIYKI